MPLWLSNPELDEPVAQRVSQLHTTRTGKTPMAVASAPATWSLIGEHTEHAGGITLMSIAQLRAAAAVSPRRDSTVTVVEHSYDPGTDSYVSKATSTPLANVSSADGTVHSERSWRLAGLIYTMIQRQMLSRESKGFDITVISDIPAEGGLGNDAAIDMALALALAYNAEDFDTPPTKAKLAEICHQAASNFGTTAPLKARYTTGIRGRAGFINILDFADGSITQAAHPAKPNKVVALSVFAPVGKTQPAEIKRRQDFIEEATKAFGAESIRLLPDAQTRVLDWLKAVHEVRGTDGVPAPIEAGQWLDFHAAELESATTAVQLIRARRLTQLYPVLADSQNHMATLYGTSDTCNQIAQLCLSRGALSARSAHSGISNAVITLIDAKTAHNFTTDLSDDGFLVTVLDDGVPAELWGEEAE